MKGNRGYEHNKKEERQWQRKNRLEKVATMEGLKKLFGNQKENVENRVADTEQLIPSVPHRHK